MIEVRTPARLHFGLLAYSRDDGRQFGGAGLAIQRPGALIRVKPADDGGFIATGPLADRAVEFARRFAQNAAAAGWGEVAPAAIEVVRVPRPHTGLGTGTQLAMAISRALATRAGRDALPPAALATLAGRGKRSANGVYGVYHGGFIVEGGKSPASTLAPMVMRHPFPDEWRIVVIRPRSLEGLAGEREHYAFADMPAIPADLTARMSRLVLLGLAPALVEHDLDAFGEALFELQQLAGGCFATAQGGIYADPLLARIVEHVRTAGVRGVGQSSWGPTLYAITRDQRAAEALAGGVESAFGLAKPGEVVITAADNRGSHVRRIGSPPRSAR
jgi:beta-RFAP synthase